jgi:hypothetical protein
LGFGNRSRRNPISTHFRDATSGGCRTSVELAMDDIPDCRDVKGFHQLFLYGDHSAILKGYCQLAGIQAVHI